MNWSSLFSQFARPRRRRKGAAAEPAREPSQLRVESLEDRCVMAAVPVVTAPTTVTTLIGEQVDFDITFDNQANGAPGGNVGYGPYIDLFLDTTGKDGISPGTPSPANTYDGFNGTFSATYLGQSLPSVQFVTITGSTFVHPLTGKVTTVPGYSAVPTDGARFHDGDTVAVLQMPFGSFTDSQPPATIHISMGTSNLADLTAPLAVTAQGGFRYGLDPLDNPGLDPVIQGAAVNTNVNLELWTVEKIYIGPEDETATGPNFKREYRIEVDIATGQKIDNLTIQDILNRSLQYTGSANVTATVHGATVANNLTSQPSVNDTAGSQTLVNNFGSVTGQAGVDATLQFQFFVTLNENDVIATPGPGDGPVLPQGQDRTTETNFATAAGFWDTIDTRDPNTSVTKDSNTHTLEEQSIVTQKRVTVVDRNTLLPVPGGVITPGYTLLRYDVDFQVSDYFAFENIFLQDLLSDGQRLYAAIAPTLTVNNAYNAATNTRSNSAAAAFGGAGTIVYQERFTTRGTSLSDPTAGPSGAVYNILADAPGPTGETFMQFNISQELIARGYVGGKLVGGNVDDGGSDPRTDVSAGYGSYFGGTTGRITFYVEVKDEFSDEFPSGDRSVDQLDVLSNDVPLIQGRQLDTTNLTTPLGNGTTTGIGTDDTHTDLVIPIGDLNKTLYAVNGQTVNLGQPVTVQPGDLVTYRLTYTLPISSFEDLSITDYLPLPVLPVPVALTFNSTAANGTIPLVNQITKGPGDTYFSTVNPFGAPVEAATTGNLAGYSVAGGGQFTGVTVVDGVNLVNGNRVLVKNQADARENGIYVSNGAGGLTRAGDFNDTVEVINSKLFRVSGGTLNGGQHFFQENKLFTTLNGAVGTGSAINWTAFAQTATDGNSFTLNLGTYDDIPFGGVRRASTIDVLVTLRVADANFTSELFLTNQMRVSESATNAPGQVFDQIVMFEVVTPNVNIYKGIVGYDLTGLTLGGITFVDPSVTSNFTGTVTSGTGNTANTDAATIGASDVIGNLDAGDEVRYGVVIQNTGRGDAYDVTFTDILQPEFQTPTTAAGFAAATNLTVRRGNGTLLEGQLVDEYVRLSSTVDLGLLGGTFSAGTFTGVRPVIDGQTLAVGDHILVKNQGTASENGLYAVTAIDTTDPANPLATLTRYGTFAIGYAVAVLGGLLASNANHFFTAASANGTGAWNTGTLATGGVVHGYYYTYDPTTRAFSLNLTDAYTAGNTTTDTQDLRAGGLSRGIAGGQNFFGGTNVTTTVATTGALGGVYDPTGGPGTGQLSGVSSTIDGVTVVAGNTVLVKNQADGRENGIYTVASVTGGLATLVRASSMDANGDLAANFVAAVTSGTANGGKRFQTPGGVQLNVNPIQWASERTYVGNGSDTVVVTYDLRLDTTAGGAQNTNPPTPNQLITNTAVLSRVDKSDGGPPAPPTSDPANVRISNPTIQKTLVGTEVNAPGNNQGTSAGGEATIGEYVTYTVVVSVPEGVMPNAVILDNLDPGLAFVDVTNVVINSNALSSNTTGLPNASGLSAANNGAANAAVLTANMQVTNSGQTVNFRLGTFTNTNLDDSSTETITITYRVVVLNVNSGTADASGNQAGNQRNNSAQIQWAGNTNTVAAVSAANVTIVEPRVDTIKQVQNVTQGGGFQDTISADNNDVVQYRIQLIASGSTSYDVTLLDPLPAAGLFTTALSIFSVSGTGTITVTGGTLASSFTISGNTLQLLGGRNIDMEQGSIITITLQGTYAGSTGLSIPNTASVQWTSLDGAPGQRSTHNTSSTERTGADGGLGLGSLNDYRTSDTATIEGPPLVYKTIVATSEPNTAGPATNGAGPGLTSVDGAIGELVRYRLYVSVGEGTTNNFQVQDFIPQGMRFLNDGSARYQFITNGAGIVSTPVGPTLALPTSSTAGSGGSLNGLSSSSIAGVFGDVNISFDATGGGAGGGEASLYSEGQDVFFRFGTLTNSDNDTDAEFVVIEFNALVLNVLGNQNAGTLTNNFGVLVDTDGSGTPGYISVVQDVGTTRGSRDASDVSQSAGDTDNNITTGSETDAARSNDAVVTIVEPNVQVVKNVLTTSTNLGVTQVTYRITVRNNSTTADAFDVHLRDVLPASLDLQGTISNPLWTGAPGVVTDNTNVGTDTVDLVLDRLLKNGQSFSFDYTTNVTPGTEYPGATTIDNTINVDYTSLPGTAGTGGNWTGVPDIGGVPSANSTVPGAAGTSTGERTGQNGKGGLNDYVDSDKQSLGSLGNRVYFDLDGDGVQDAGEAGIVGVTVTLIFDADNNGVYGNAGDSTVTAVTGADGKYLFNGLPLFFTNPTTGAQTAAKYQVSVPATVAGMTVTDAFNNGLLSATATVTPTLSGTTGDSSNVQNRRDVDFGYRGTNQIGDRVYIDADGDGVQDANGLEPNLPGVDVGLTWAGLDGTLGTADDIVLTTKSSNPANPLDPNYLFDFLPVGTFKVDFSGTGGIGGVPSNMTLTDSVDNGLLSPALGVNVNFPATGAKSLIVDLGYKGTASIGDTVWYDADGDGVQDTGATNEPGIAGAAVTLVFGGADGNLATATDNVTFTTTTDLDGKYLFSGLPVWGAGSPYKVTVVPPAAYPTQTYDKDGTGSANNSTLTLGPAEANLLQDFGYRGTAKLGDFVFEDFNGNGRQDGGDTGLQGVPVDLMMAGADNTFGTGDDIVVLSTTTDANGLYAFNNLAAANYQVRFGAKAGYVRTNKDTPITGATDANDSDADPTSGRTGTYSLALGATNNTIDAGYYRLQDIGDTVWYDVNDSGGAVQQAGEPGIPNVKVTLDYAGLDGIFGGANAADDVLGVASTTTDKFGNYLFADRIPGTYRVSVDPTTLPNGVTTQTFDLDGIGTGNNAVLNLVSGTDRLDADFSYTATGKLGDRVYIDADGDGVQDKNPALPNVEPSLPGVVVTLVWAGFDGDFSKTADNVTLTQTTTNPVNPLDPNYLFVNLASGSYQVSVSPTGGVGGVPDNAALTDSVDDGTLTAAATVNVALPIGGDETTIDFGYRGNSSIGDTVWYDADGDGAQQTGAITEPGIAGATVTLLWGGLDGLLSTTGDNVAFTTTTDASGKYLFQGLPVNGPSDEYKVTVAPPTNFPFQTYDADGTGTANSSALLLPQNTANLLQDFGYRGNASLGDFVWEDLNGNGRQDSGEPGLSGVTVDLLMAGADNAFGTGDDIVVLTTVTDGAGLYAFDNLGAADYQVRFGGKTGYVRTQKDSVVANDGNDSDAQTNADPALDGRTGTYTVALGSANSTIDSGLYRLQDVGDFVWFDYDGDGVQDGAGEPGLQNVTVTLDYAGLDGVFNTADDVLGVDSMQTDANGGYLFADRIPGTYRVNVVAATLPAGIATPTFDFDQGTNGLGNNAVFPLTSGIDEPRIDFGYRGVGAIGDRVFFDFNKNGSWEAGEGLANVTVTLVGDVNGDGKNETYTTKTDSDGYYQFVNLPAPAGGKTYDVTVTTTDLPRLADGTPLTNTVDPDGGFDSTAKSTLTAAAPSDQTRDFGYRGDGSIGDEVFLDVNNNGKWDSGEGITGVKVTLTGDIDGDGQNETFSLLTDSNGKYTFGDLPVFQPDGTTPIAWNVKVDATTLPQGVTNTFDPQGPVDSQWNGNLQADPTLDNVDFGYQGALRLGDYVWLDMDGDKNQDAGEPGLTGVKVTLTADVNGDGLNDLTISTLTDADGEYLFSRLPRLDSKGAQIQYTVKVDTTTLPQDGSGNPLVNTADPDNAAPPNQATVAFLTNADRLDVDFGYNGPGAIGDFVWLDVDADGVQDPGEPGIANVVVTLAADVTGDGLPELFTTKTDSEGMYVFPGLPIVDAKGKTIEYTVTVAPATLPQGVGNTPIAPTFDFDGGKDNTSKVSLSAAFPTNALQDFGYVGPGSIGDTVFLDSDGDGNFDPGEGINGAKVTLTGDFDGDGKAETFTAVTKTDGTYDFPGLPIYDLNGNKVNYTVTVDPTTLPQGIVNTVDPDGGGDGIWNGDLVADPNLDTVDFGYVGALDLGDYVWMDVDGDKVQDAGEPGLTGVKVTLTADVNGDGTNDLTLVDVTDAAGGYLFTNLPRLDSKGNPIQYTVKVDTTTLPQDGLGAPLTNVADPDGGTADQATVTFPTNADRLDVDFGYQGPGRIGDFVWLDVDGDGVQDPAEPGVANVVITITADVTGDGLPEVFTTKTDSEGKYFVPGLPIVDAKGNTIEYTVAVLQSTLPQDEAGNPIDNTFDADGGNDAVSKVSLSAAQPENLDQDFGFVGPGSIGDKVFLDVDDDGVWDVGEGINGVKVTLTGDFDGDGKDETFTTVTAMDGTYTFAGLPVHDLNGDPIEYTVTVDPGTLPIDVEFTADPEGPLDGIWTGNLTDGPNLVDVDFGVQGPARLGDLVWIDADADGVLDVTESGVTGVRIFVEADVNGDGTQEKFQAFTDASGIYGFVGLPPRDKDGNTIQYNVIVDQTTLPGGVEAVSDPDTVTDPVNGVFGDNQSFLTFPAPTLAVPNPENLDQDFGYRLPGVIGDTIFLDVDNDGLPDPGEGLGGVTVRLTADLNGDGLDETFTLTTDEDGKYNFTGLPFSRFDGSVIEYTVTVDPAGNTLPPGVLNSADPDGGLDGTSKLTLSKADPINNDQDFGYRGPKAIEGSVYIDLDQDGDRGDEPGIPGVPVILVYNVDDDSAGVPGGKQKLERVVTFTDANGNYSFSGLPAFRVDGQLAKYFVIEGEQPPQFLDGLEELRGVVLLGTDYFPRDKLDELPFIEFNADNLPEVVVRNNFGEYLIPELPKDPPIAFPVTTLTVPRVEEAGYYREEFRLKNPNDLDRRSIRREELEYASVEGVVFSDGNNNGSFNSNELGIPGVLIKLVGPSNRQAVTDDDGRYSFDQLPVGTYSIIEIRPNGMLRGKLSVGSAGGGTSDNAFTDVGLSAGQRGMNYNFGELPPARVAGKSFLDTNRNGVQDPGEMGMPGVLVKVSGVDDRGAPVNVGAFTGWDGAFSVEDLRPGVYTVTQMPPPMFRNGPATAGPGGGTAGNGTVSGVEVTPAAAPGGMVFPVQMVDTPQNAAAPLRWLWGAMESPMRAFGLGQAGEAKPEKAASRAEGKTSDARHASEGNDVARNFESSPYEAAAMGAIGLAGMLVVSRPAVSRRSQTWEESVDRLFSGVGEDN